MAEPTIRAIVRDQSQTLFEGTAIAVSSVNEKGPFDILAHHSNFISLIKDQVTITHTDGSKQMIKLNAGVLRNVDNVVEIYIGVETL